MAEGRFDENAELLKNTDEQDYEDGSDEMEMKEMEMKEMEIRKTSTSHKTKETSFIESDSRASILRGDLIYVQRTQVKNYFPEMTNDIVVGIKDGKLAVKLFGDEKLKLLLNKDGTTKVFKGELAKALGPTKHVIERKHERQKAMDKIDEDFPDFNTVTCPFIFEINENEIFVKLKSRENATLHKLYNENDELNENLPGLIKKSLGQQISKGLKEKLKYLKDGSVEDKNKILEMSKYIKELDTSEKNVN